MLGTPGNQAGFDFLQTVKKRGRVKPRLEKEFYDPALQFLNVQPGTKAWRHRNNAVYSPEKRCFLKMPKHELGVPDILGVKDGRCFAFELKREGEKARLEQRMWMEHFDRCGGKAFVVDTLDDLMECWKEI